MGKLFSLLQNSNEFITYYLPYYQFAVCNKLLPEMIKNQIYSDLRNNNSETV